MSSKLFAFNMSKKPEKVSEKADNQWIGDLIARATVLGQCTGGQDYGIANCQEVYPGECSVFGGSGYYICDGSCPDTGC